MKTYKIEHPGWTDYFDLHVFRTNRQMVAYLRKLGLVVEDYCYGLVKPMWYRVNSSTGEVATSNKVCDVYLNEEHLVGTVIVHEGMHVAMAHERQIMRFGMAYGEQCNEDEERLAYTLGRVTNSILNMLIANGHMEG